MNYISTVSKNSLNGLLRDFDQLTNRVFGDLDRPVNFPRVDVLEDAQAYFLEAELPGYSEKDVDVRVKDGLLTISGKKADSSAQNSPEVRKYLIKERYQVEFERSFKLPKDADQDQISGVHRNGVLTLTISRKPEAQPRTITIRSE